MRKFIGTIVIVFGLGWAAVHLFGARLAAGVIEGATGAKASVRQLHFKLFPLEVGVYGTRIHNLDGFKEPEFISIPEIFLRIELLDLIQGTIHVERISLNIDQIIFEKSQNGKVNLKELLDRSKQKQKEASSQSESSPSTGTSGQPTGKDPGPKVQIDEVTLNLGNLMYVDYGTGTRVVKNMNLNVKDEALRNVSDPFSLTQQVIIVILKRIGFSTLGIQMDIFKGSLEEQAGQFLNQAKSKLSEIFN